MNAKVLLVDDDPNVLNTLEQILGESNFDLTMTTDGHKALKIIDTQDLDLIITDLKMPEITGEQIVAKGKAKDPNVEIIVLTGYATVDKAIELLRGNGAFDFLSKPLEDIEHLSHSANQALAKRRLTLENNALLEKLRHEIKRHKRTEDRLRKSQDLLVKILNNIQAHVFVTDLETCEVIFMNKMMTECFGANLIGKKCKETLRPYNESCNTCCLIGSGQWSTEIKNWEEFNPTVNKWFINYIRIIKWLGNRTVRLHVGADITEFKLANERKRELEVQLRQAQKLEAVGTLAGGIAHDFNNLLMGIQGNVDLMSLDLGKDSPFGENLENISQYVASGANLAQQLLGFARKGKYRIRPMNINILADKCVRMFGRAKKEVEIKTSFHAALWPIAGDHSQIEQVIMNILVNAWQAMPEGGKIYISTENKTLDDTYIGLKPFKIKPGSYIKVSVTDTGLGMDEETRSKIFEPFFTTKYKSRGTGLGLASVYGIIKNHGGLINVYSEKKIGTTFNVYLPSTDQAPDENKASIKPLQVKGGTETILLVDDETMIINVGGLMLKKMGYQVLTANSGSEALKIYKSRKDEIALILLDLIMPGMNGVQTYDRLKLIDADVQVLLSSGYSMNEDVDNLLKKGCKGFIQKPFSSTELAEKIRLILDRKIPDNFFVTDQFDSQAEAPTIN